MSDNPHYNPQDNGDGNSNGNSNGWNTYAKLVLSELERLQDNYDKLELRLNKITEETIPAINTEIATLKVKAMIFGAAGGTVFSAIMFAIFEYIFHHS